MSTTTTTTYPLDRAESPCPAWCASEAGHGYESESHDGLTDYRWHASEVGRVEAAGGAVLVELAAEESLTGGTVRVERPSVQLFADVRHGERGLYLTAVSASQVAAVLLEAAARLREIEGGPGIKVGRVDVAGLTPWHAIATGPNPDPRPVTDASQDAAQG